MRILLLTEGMERGGAETHVAALARGLRNAGDEVEVLSAGGREAERLAREGIRQICVPFCRTPVGAVKSVLAMRRVIKRGKYDVLHAHARYPSFLLRVAAFGRRTPIAVTAHARFRHGPLLRRVCFWGDFTVAVSEDIRCDLLRFCRLPKDRVFVIPNGIDVRLFSPPQAEDDGLYPSVGGPCVGFASRMDADCSRGAELLCAIAPHLAKAFPDLCITLAGGGTELEKIRALAQKANADVGREVVRTVGWVEDMAAFWRAQEICVAVSRAAMEGAATGCAVLLCGNEGYLGPLCKENAERALESNFCCRGEENATAERLLRDLLPLLSDASLRRRVTEEGRGFVLSHLSLDAMVERTRALYARLAQKEATKAPRTRVFSSKKETPHSPYFLGRRKKFIPHKPAFFCKKREKNPHLLVGGYFGCGNLGDDAILLGFLSLLRELAPEMRVSVLSGDPRATRALCHVDAYRRKSPLALLRAFLNADAFLLGGGSLLQNRTGRLSLAYYLGLLRLSRFLKKPTALFAAGIGPLLGETDRQKTRLVLSSLFHVGLRDPLSLSALRSLGLPASLLSLGSDPAFFITPTCNTLVGSDLAFFLHSFPTFTANTPKKKQLSPTLQKKEREKTAPFPTVFSSSFSDFHGGKGSLLRKMHTFPTLPSKQQEKNTFFPTESQKEGVFQKNQLVLLLRSCRDLPELPKILSLRVGKFCRKNGLSLLLLPMDLRADLALSRQGAEIGGGRLLCPKDPRELLSLLSASRACVTLRLHGAILSSSAGLPCLCISPDREDQKLAAFSETLGQEHLSSTEAADGACLEEALSRLLKKDAAFSHRLLLAVEEERKKARKDLAKLLEMLYNERR